MAASIDALADSAFQGDRDAWLQLYEALTPRILGLVRPRVATASDAEEIVMLTWEKVFLRFDTYNPSHSFRSWVFAIAINACRDQLRRAKGKPQFVCELLADLDMENSEERNDELLEQIPRLRSCVEALNSTERNIVRLRYWGGKTHGQIGCMVGKRSSQIRAMCHRAVRKLVKCMGV